jgi:hypothetical protein
MHWIIEEILDRFIYTVGRTILRIAGVRNLDDPLGLCSSTGIAFWPLIFAITGSLRSLPR